ncbi:MAG: hypothetical protein COA42_08130 [Alteromonadaceae bacterium]|nr:MAG: hypothetical protein COA42_08130 [Alteromonadaceae bacterium]
MLVKRVNDVFDLDEFSTEEALGQSVGDAAGYKAASLFKSDFEQPLDQLALSRDVSALVAITLYNESGASLSASLASLASSVESLFCAKRASCASLSSKNSASVFASSLDVVSVCILVDGLECLSDSAAKLMQSFDIDVHREQNECGEMTVHKRSVSTTQLKTLADKIQFEPISEQERWGEVAAQALTVSDGYSGEADDLSSIGASNIQLLLCVKSKNAGKLDSHWWFYRCLSVYLRPEYCFQMDVGSAPTANTLSAMWQKFQSDDRIAGLASSIAPMEPESPMSALELWQYTNFSKTIFQDWPSEVACGYLSVIPGQFSGLRWEAIADSAYSQGEVKPLDVYFKGLDTLSPYETMLYLAEDRVLCSELVTHPGRQWKLDYVAKAEVITDFCKTWPELYKQRKRWCAGYLACRLDFLVKVPKFVANPNIEARERASKVLATAYHSLQFLLDWFVPALVGACYFELSSVVAQAYSGSALLSAAVKASAFVVFFIMFSEFLLSLRGRLDGLALRLFTISRKVQASFVVVLGVLAMSSPGAWVCVVLCLVLLLSQAASASLGGDRRARSILYHSLLVAPLRPAIAFGLWTYAICNTHDNSWGTKGLDKPEYLEGDNNGSNGKSESIRSRFLCFRKYTVLTWFVTNLSILAGLSAISGSQAPVLIPTVLALLTAAAVFPIAYRLIFQQDIKIL